MSEISWSVSYGEQELGVNVGEKLLFVTSIVKVYLLRYINVFLWLNFRNQLNTINSLRAYYRLSQGKADPILKQKMKAFRDIRHSFQCGRLTYTVQIWMCPPERNEEKNVLPRHLYVAQSEVIPSAFYHPYSMHLRSWWFSASLWQMANSV